MLLLFRPFKAGDVVEVDSSSFETPPGKIAFRLSSAKTA